MGLAALLLVIVVSASAGWLGAELNQQEAAVDPSAARSTNPTTTPGGQAAPRGSALTSVASRLIVNAERRNLAANSDLTARLPAGIDAAAVQVTVTKAAGPGVVRLDAGDGSLDAINVAEAGVTTTNLVVLPVSSRTLAVQHGPGGGLEISVVGTFSSAPESGAGRFVARKPVRVARLDVEQDGRELTVEPSAYGAGPGIRAALVLVSADVGATSPARLLVGREPGGLAERMVWGPAVGGKTQRRGLALVPVNAAGEFSLRYEHGTALDVDVLGFFTGPGAPVSNGALLVPAPPSTLFNGVLGRGDTNLSAPRDATGALLNLAAEPGVAGDLAPSDVAVASGRTLAVVVDADKGRIQLNALRTLRARVDLLGYFTRE